MVMQQIVWNKRVEKVSEDNIKHYFAATETKDGKCTCVVDFIQIETTSLPHLQLTLNCYIFPFNSKTYTKYDATDTF